MHAEVTTTSCLGSLAIKQLTAGSAKENLKVVWAEFATLSSAVLLEHTRGA